MVLIWVSDASAKRIRSSAKKTWDNFGPITGELYRLPGSFFNCLLYYVPQPFDAQNKNVWGDCVSLSDAPGRFEPIQFSLVSIY